MNELDLTVFSKKNENTIKLIFALLFIVLYLIITLFYSTLNTKPNYSYSYDETKGAIKLDSRNPFYGSYFLTGGWTFVPNYRIEDAVATGASPANREAYTNANISSSGWYDLGSDYMDFEYVPFEMDGLTLNSGAYFTSVEFPEGVTSLNLNLSHVNGRAYIYADGQYLGALGNPDKSENGKYTAGYQNITIFPGEDNVVDLAIVVYSIYYSSAPGLISYPALEHASTSTYLSTVPTTWLTLCLTISIASILGGLFLIKTFQHKAKYFLYCLFISLVNAYLLIDAGFISLLSVIKDVLLFSISIVSVVVSYWFIDSLFYYTNQARRSRKASPYKLHYDVYAITIIGIILILLLFTNIELMKSGFITIVSYIFTCLSSVICIIKVLLHHLNEKHSTIAICASISTIFIFLTMLNENMPISNIPLYSIYLVFVMLAIIGMFLYKYSIQYKTLIHTTKHLQTIVEEKTSHISEINRDLHRTNKQLMANEKARRNIMSNVSHDLRTPITAISGYAELLTKGEGKLSSERRIEYLTNIKKRSDQMECIVSDLVEISRMESSGDEFQFMELSLCELLFEEYALFKIELDEKEHTIEIDLPDTDPLLIMADHKKLSRMVNNLLSNAVNYSKEKAHISISAWRNTDTNNVHMRISDNGIGIPSDALPHIFDRFYRASNSGQNIHGTGLGLAIVKMVVDKHDATINVESELGVGTTFEIVFKGS